MSEVLTFEARHMSLADSRREYGFDERGEIVNSTKNFHLATSDVDGDGENSLDGECATMCRCGKIDDFSFALDFKPPFTALQAFAIALSQFA